MLRRPTLWRPWACLSLAWLLAVSPSVAVGIDGTLPLGGRLWAQDAGDEADVSARADRIIKRYGNVDLQRAWQGARALEALGDDVLPIAQNLLASGTPLERLMAAKTLISLGEAGKIERELRKLAEDTEIATEQRAAAVELLADFPSSKTDKLLEGLLEGDESYDPLLRIAAAHSLFKASRSGKLRRLARSKIAPLLTVDDPAVQNAAALALGEMGYVEERAKEILTSLANEPTPDGSQARLILQNDLLMRRLERMMDSGAVSSTPEQNRLIETLERQLQEKDRELDRFRKRFQQEQGNRNHPLIAKVLELIEDLYADPERVDRNQLIVAAAKGIAKSLDPFSSFMDPSDTTEFYEGISGQYAGIGAQVAKDPDDDTLLILRPIYKGPAYKANVLTDDKILEVEGFPTKGATLDEIVKHLKGEPNTPVHLKVLRRGWREAREKTVMREIIQLDSVLYTMLPGSIGFLRLSQFGDSAITEFNNALDDLESLGMKGFILDLRNNPGGYLQAACEIVDAFVGEDPRPIVTQRGHSPTYPPSIKKTTAAVRGTYPIVVLVNRSSASASEIVSGALQDFERATIVGTQTFGKGSVQRLLTMSDEVNTILGGESVLRLTVQYYYLPSGRSIHTQRDKDGKVTKEGGVQPDIEVEPLTIPLWRIEAVSLLDDAEVFDQYLDKYFQPNKELFYRIAQLGDGGKTSVYPDFDEFFKSRNEHHAEIDDIRYRLRSRIRRKVEDERGAQFACDFSEDRQLQRGILAMLEKLTIDPQSIDQYKVFADSFSETKDEATEEKSKF